MWQRKQLPAFKTATAGQPNDLFVPDGVKLQKVTFEIGDAAGTQLQSGNLVTNIEVLTDGATQRKCSAIQLNAINSLRGSRYAIHTSGTPGTAGFRTYLSIFFASPWIFPRQAGNAFGWNLTPGTNLQIRVTLAAGLTGIVLQGWMYYSALDGALGLIEKWYPTQLQVSGSSNEHVKVPGVKELVQSMHWFPQASGIYVSALTVKRGTGNTLIDTITYLQNQASLLENGYQPDTIAAPRYDFLADEEDPLDAGLAVTGDELSFKTDYSASTTGTMDLVTVVLGNQE